MSENSQENVESVSNSLAELKTSLRGELITRDDQDAFTTARFRGWNRDLNTRSNPLGFVIASGGAPIIVGAIRVTFWGVIVMALMAGVGRIIGLTV